MITTTSSRTEENKPLLRDISFEKRGIIDSGKSGFVDSLFKPWKLYSISDMSLFTLKVEMQTDQLEHLREKVRTAQDETRSVQAKNELLERFVDQEPLFPMFVLTNRWKTPTSFFFNSRKLSDSDQQNRELIGVISKKEESLYQSQVRSILDVWNEVSVTQIETKFHPNV